VFSSILYVVTLRMKILQALAVLLTLIALYFSVMIKDKPTYNQYQAKLNNAIILAGLGK